MDPTLVTRIDFQKQSETLAPSPCWHIPNL